MNPYKCLSEKFYDSNSLTNSLLASTDSWNVTDNIDNRIFNHSTLFL